MATTDIPVITFGTDDSRPALIVLQEWWGITDQIKSQAEYLEKQGYVTMIPDLYRGKLGLEVEEAHHLMTNLDFAGAVEDIGVCVSKLRLQNPNRPVGIVGFCMGGALALAASTLLENIQACVCFYGIPSDELCDLSTLKTPTQCHFGELDSLEGFSDVATVDTRVRGVIPSVDLHMYSSVGHAFMNDIQSEWALKTRQKLGFPAIDTSIIDLAWKRTLQFFSQHLK